jgi:hypothetical protein
MGEGESSGARARDGLGCGGDARGLNTRTRFRRRIVKFAAKVISRRERRDRRKNRQLLSSFCVLCVLLRLIYLSAWTRGCASMIRSAVAERSDDTALASPAPNPKRRGASLPAAVQSSRWPLLSALRSLLSFVVSQSARTRGSASLPVGRSQLSTQAALNSAAPSPRPSSPDGGEGGNLRHPFCDSFAQVSLSGMVRLKIGLPGRVSGSSAK